MDEEKEKMLITTLGLSNPHGDYVVIAPTSRKKRTSKAKTSHERPVPTLPVMPFVKQTARQQLQMEFPLRSWHMNVRDDN
jgi:hypothetical protein